VVSIILGTRLKAPEQYGYILEARLATLKALRESANPLSFKELKAKTNLPNKKLSEALATLCRAKCAEYFYPQKTFTATPLSECAEKFLGLFIKYFKEPTEGNAEELIMFLTEMLKDKDVHQYCRMFRLLRR
jgi:hypothetical protein